MNNLKIMWTFSWTGGLVHNLVSIIPDCNFYNLQTFEDIIDYFGLCVLLLTLFPTSFDGFSPAILKLVNPDYLKHNLDYIYNYVYKIYAFVKILNEFSVIICSSCHPGHQLYLTTKSSAKSIQLLAIQSHLVSQPS